MASIESTASTKRKTKESIRIESLLPQDLRENSARLIRLLEDYYRFMNQGFQPSYELNSVSEERDIDTAEHYLDQIQKEIAVTIPRAIQTDRVKLYKNLVRYYNLRGSTESIETFFKILLEDEVEIYYPKNDMLIPSDGKWDQRLDNEVSVNPVPYDNNFLEDTEVTVRGDYIPPDADTSVVVRGNYNQDNTVTVKGNYISPQRDTSVTLRGDYNPDSVIYLVNEVVKDTSDNNWYKNIVAYASNNVQPSSNTTNWIRYDDATHSIINLVPYVLFAYVTNDVVKDIANNNWYKNIADYSSDFTQPSSNTTNWVRYDDNGYSVDETDLIAYAPSVDYVVNDVVKDPIDNNWYKNILDYSSGGGNQPSGNITNWVRYDDNGYSVVNLVGYLPGTSYSINDVVKDDIDDKWYKNILDYTSYVPQPSTNPTNWVRYDENGYAVVDSVAYLPGVTYSFNEVVKDPTDNFWYKNILEYTSDAYTLTLSSNRKNWARYDTAGHFIQDGVPYSGRYLSNDGFISDKKKLQDSYFYQKFSYVIRTGNNVDKWRDVYNKLVHPSGFIYFGEIFLLLLALADKAKMPLLQPGLISEEDLPILVQMIATSNKVSLAYAEFTLLLALTYVGEFYTRRSEQFSDLLKFYDETPLQDFRDFTIQEGINKTIDRINVQSSVYTYDDNNLIDGWLNGYHSVVWPYDGQRSAFL